MISFQDMYQKYRPDVFRFAYWLSRNHHDAEDISNETFVRAWAGSGKLKAQTLKGYLLKIARNLWLDQLKHSKRFTPVFEREVDGERNPEESILHNESMLTVQRALAELRSSDRHILFLRYTEELSYKEIADCLDIRLNAVKVALHRAKNRLGQRIKEEK